MAQDAAIKTLVSVPSIAPGIGLSEAIQRAVLVEKSSVVNFDDTTVVNLFEVGANVLILGAAIHVKSAFDVSGTSEGATATITVPNDTGGTDTILDCGVAPSALQATGFFLSTGMAITPATGGNIALNYTPGTTVAGQLEVYLQYLPLGDKL